jgi:hypothetical protein
VSDKNRDQCSAGLRAISPGTASGQLPHLFFVVELRRSSAARTRTVSSRGFAEPELAGNLRIEERELETGAELEGRFHSEACSALASVLEAGGPTSPLLRRGACVDPPSVGGPSCLLGARHLANHQFPGRHLLSNELELRLVALAIAL